MATDSDSPPNDSAPPDGSLVTSSPWAPTTVPFDPQCSSGCDLVRTLEGVHHHGSMLLVHNPDVDDATAQWARCVASFVFCAQGGEGIRTCVEESDCPEVCKAEWARLAPDDSDAMGQWVTFREVVVNDDAPCGPREAEVEP